LRSRSRIISLGAAGKTLNWSSTTLNDHRELGSGPATADRWGLVTIEKLAVGESHQRIAIQRK
jgi:hypothetical protein